MGETELALFKWLIEMDESEAWHELKPLNAVLWLLLMELFLGQHAC